ncbi:MAG: zf-HC2 domain-containing protein [Chloroflexi bacterium]|nr:zf-HC2 domain-containing protein [Chloroflexota bacterium]
MAFRGADHRFAQENLSAYIDGRLEPREHARLTRHIAACSICSADLETLRQTKALLGQMPRMAAPRSFALPASAQSERARYQRLNRTYKLLRGASTVAAVLLVVLLAGGTVLGFLGAGGARSTNLQPLTYSAAPADTADHQAGGDMVPAATAVGAYPAQIEDTQQPPATTIAAYPLQAEGAGAAAGQPASGTESQATGEPSAKFGAQLEGTPSADELDSTRTLVMGEPSPTPEQPAEPSQDTAAAAPEQAYPEAIQSAEAVNKSVAGAAPEAEAGAAPEPTADTAIALVGNGEPTAASAQLSVPGEAASPNGASGAAVEPHVSEPYTAALHTAAIALGAALALLLGALAWIGYRRKH